MQWLGFSMSMCRVAVLAVAICGFAGLMLGGEAGAQVAPEAAPPGASTRPLSLEGSPPATREQRAARPPVQQRRAAPTPDARGRLADRMNAGTVTIISGGVAGTYVRIAADIATVLDDGDALRILPVIGKGSRQNIKDIMYLRGVDLGLVQSDTLENAKRDPELADAERQITYIARLYNEEIHIVARADIPDVRQLAGKRVNIDLAASGTAATARLFFERLGVTPTFVNLDQRTALEQLRTGQIDANVFIGGKPVQAVSEFRGDGRFRLLPLPYDPRLQDIYFPAEFSNADYRDLVPPGQTVETVAVATILAAYNWPEGSERYQRLSRFVDAFFSKFDEFSKPGRHPKWQEVNIAATVPGWRRFKPATDWVERSTGGAQTASRSDFVRFLQEREQAGAARATPAEQERLFQDFQRWQQRARPAAR
jgi:TRAP transporter TAXI family solute receptor